MSVCPYKARAKVILGNLTFHALPWVLESISSLAQVRTFQHSDPPHPPLPHLTSHLIFSPGRRHSLFLLNVRADTLPHLGLGNILPSSHFPALCNLQVVSYVRERPQKVSITQDIEQSLEYPTITICSPAFFNKTRLWEGWSSVGTSVILPTI